MLSRRSFIQRTSGGLIALGQARSTPPGTTQVFYDPATLRHEPSPDHPESPQRIQTVRQIVGQFERQGRLAVVAPRTATDDDVLLVHTVDYVKKVRAETAAGRRTLSTGDTEISPGSLGAALAAAGTVVSAVDAVVSGRTRTAFCAVRPPGHER